jgi:radical SAM superfamily enzyme YgiQ (UPF0313 family)
MAQTISNPRNPNFLILDTPTTSISSTVIAQQYAKAISLGVMEKYKTKAFGDHLIFPPPRSYKVALLRIGTVLIENGLNVEYVNTDYDSLDKFVNAAIQTDVLFVSDTTPQVNQILEYIRLAKQANNKIIVISGGHHSTHRPSDLIGSGKVDFAVAGEAESFLLQVIGSLINLDWAKIKRHPHVSSRDNIRQVSLIDLSKNFGNMDSLPLPSYNLLPGGLSSFHAYFVGSRGCGCNCCFCCSDAMWPKTRRFSPKRYSEELLKIREITFRAYNVLHIADDRPPLDESYWKAIEEVLNKYPDTRLFCEMRLKECTRTNLEILRDHNVVQINIGIESLAPEVLRIIRPWQNLDIVRKILKEIQKVFFGNVFVKGYFMIGLPGETQQSICKTINSATLLVKDGLLDYPSFRMFKPLPGSEIHQDPDSYNISIKDEDLSNYERYSYPSIHSSQNLDSDAIYSGYLLSQEVFSNQIFDSQAKTPKTDLKTKNNSTYRDHLGKLI